MGNFRGQLLLDGGMVDNVPAFLAESVEGVRKNLVLLTRPYPEGALRSREERLYLGPTRPVPIERWDYTRPDLLEATLAMGHEEAATHDAAFSAFLA